MPVLKTSVVEFPAGNLFIEPRRFQSESVDDLPDVPILPETLLTMELQLQENSVDLTEFTEAVLGDLGATLQILRLAGQEYGSSEYRPVRIEDCISDLGPSACLEAVARGSFVRGPQQRADFETWTHSKEIARYFRLLAETMPGSISPDQAYVAGLLHAIGTLPETLGWQSSEMNGNHALTALKLAERWHFPGYVKDFFCEMLIPGYHPYWSKLMERAHLLAKDSQALCPLARTMALPLNLVS
jgi:hypothetical protein